MIYLITCHRFKGGCNDGSAIINIFVVSVVVMHSFVEQGRHTHIYTHNELYHARLVVDNSTRRVERWIEGSRTYHRRFVLFRSCFQVAARARALSGVKWLKRSSGRNSHTHTYTHI